MPGPADLIRKDFQGDWVDAASLGANRQSGVRIAPGELMYGNFASGGFPESFVLKFAHHGGSDSSFQARILINTPVPIVEQMNLRRVGDTLWLDRKSNVDGASASSKPYVWLRPEMLAQVAKTTTDTLRSAWQIVSEETYLEWGPKGFWLERNTGYPQKWITERVIDNEELEIHQLKSCQLQTELSCVGQWIAVRWEQHSNGPVLRISAPNLVQDSAVAALRSGSGSILKGFEATPSRNLLKPDVPKRPAKNTTTPRANQKR
jgi:hypothetical protein